MKRYTVTVQKAGHKFSDSFDFDQVEDFLNFINAVRKDPKMMVHVYNNDSHNLIFYKHLNETTPFIDRFTDAGNKEWCCRIWTHTIKHGWQIETEESFGCEAEAASWGSWYISTWPNVHSLERKYEIVQQLPFTCWG